MGLFGNLFKNDMSENEEVTLSTNTDKDVEAMLDAADRCLAKGTVGGCKEALEWFSAAAEHGNHSASLSAAMCCENIAEACMEHSIYNQETFDYWKNTSLHAMNAMRAYDSDDYESALALSQKGLVGMAFCSYIAKQTGNAMNQLEMIGSYERSDAHLLKALCMLRSASTNDDVQKIYVIFGHFLFDREYLSGVAEKGILEQMIVSASALLFYSMLNKGVGSVISQDTNLAATVINWAYESLTFEVAKKPLEKYISQ